MGNSGRPGVHARTATCVLGIVLLFSGLTADSAPALETGCESSDISIDASNLTRAEHALLCLTNEYRQANGKGLLSHDTRLAASARAHSHDMAQNNFATHTNPQGQGPRERAEAAGYPVEIHTEVGENIAARSPSATPAELFTQLTESAPHDNNMLWGNYKSAGFGIVTGFPQAGANGVTATEVFTSGPADTAITGLDPFDPYAYPGCAEAATKLRRAKKRLRRAIRAKRRARTKAERRRRARTVRKRRADVRRATQRHDRECAG